MILQNIVLIHKELITVGRFKIVMNFYSEIAVKQTRWKYINSKVIAIGQVQL